MNIKNLPDGLQEKFPLSSKKFWKKYLSANISLLVITIILTPFIILVISSLSTYDQGAFYVGLVIISLFVLLCIISLLRAWYIKAYIRSYYYNNEKNYITIRKGVFTSAEIHVPYHKIQDVYVDQDFLDRIMGLYDVHIASATIGSSIEAHIDGVEKKSADGLKDFLLSKIQNSGENSSENGVDIKIQPNITNSNKIILNFDNKISSDEYPIISAWWIGSILSRIGTLIIIAFLVMIRTSQNGINSSTIILLASFFVIGFFWGIIRLSLFVRNYSFDFTPEYLYARYGIFSITEIHMPYNTIQDVRIEQSFFDKIFGVYTIMIENAVGGGRTLALIGLSKTSADTIFITIKDQVMGKHDVNKI
ncbi:MAG: PH domain-containing protein [bacterium]